MSTTSFKKFRDLQLNMRASTCSNSSHQCFQEFYINPPCLLLAKTYISKIYISKIYISKNIVPKYKFAKYICWHFQIFFNSFNTSSPLLNNTVFGGERGARPEEKKLIKRFFFEFSVKRLKSSKKCLKLFRPFWTFSGKN